MPKKPTNLSANDIKPGAALRALRRERGWTIADVSKRTGLAVSTLSKIENDRMSLNYDKLTRLSAGLKIDIAELLAANTTPAQVLGLRSITRAGEGRSIATDKYLHRYPAGDLRNKRFVPIVAELHARSLEEFGELIRHPGEEYAYVLEGVVELHTELYAPARLEVGDSIYFDSGTAHAYIAATPGPCRVLAICSASESQLLAMSTDRPSQVKLPVRRLVAKPKPKASLKPKAATKRN
jgi:transcriptional regulator with XRE-family HTH domain